MGRKRLRAISTHGVAHTTTTRFTRTVRKLIWLASATLAAIFTWIQFSNFPADILANSTTPIVLWHGGLALYYLSWVFGTRFDVDVQELVYVAFPKKGKVPPHGFMVILSLFVAAAILLWAERDIKRFAIALDIFVVVDHLGWRYLIWLLREVVRVSRNTYRQNDNYFALEALNIVTHQLQGNWKWWRLVGTIPILAMMNLIAFSDTIHSYATTTAKEMLPNLSDQDASAFVSGTLVLCFVLVAEIWHWAIRIRTAVALDFIDKASEEYILFPANKDMALKRRSENPSRKRPDRPADGAA